MEEIESEEFIIPSKNNTNNKINNIFINNNFSISEDPIPHLIKPLKEPLPKQISISYIFQNIPKLNLTFDKNQTKSKNKLILYLLNQNIQKYNSTPDKKNLMIIDDLIKSKETHFTSIFKDKLIFDYNEEFLRGFFNLDECKEVLPKFYEYYRNYLKFFCIGTFNNFYINEIMQEYGENQAEVYYNINYKKKENLKKKDKKGNIDEKNLEETNKSKSNSNDYMSKLVSLNIFFTKSIERTIKNFKNSNNNISLKNKDKELSNIKPLKNNSKNNTINLPDNSTVSSDDVITKKSSILNIIDIMNNKIENKKNNPSNKKINKKKLKLIFFDNNNKKFVNKRNNLNKKSFNSFSKTTSNLNDKSNNKFNNINNKSKKVVSRNKGNNMKINNIISKNNKILSSSNYIKYIDVLKAKKNIKINIPKNKISQNDLILSSSRIIKNRKSSNNIASFNINDNIHNFNSFSNINISNNLKGAKNKTNNINKINLSLKMKNFYQKIKKISNNNISLYPLSTSKGKIHKNNINKKSESKEKNPSKTKTCGNCNNQNNNCYFKKNITKKINKNIGISFSPKNTYIHNKSLSYSTVNNCNININNNIILSNNYFNNKYSNNKQMNNSNKKLFEKNLTKNNYHTNNNSKQFSSRNIKIDLDKFKTEENIVNSIILKNSNHKILKNKNNSKNIQYSSFRKSNNNEITIKQRNLFKIKNANINHKKNLTLKDIPIMNKTKSNITTNSSKKIYINDDYNSINKTYKNIYMKKSNNNQKKIIFDYKKK